MSIHKLYADNGNIPGFWVQHRSWQNICARVVTMNPAESDGARRRPSRPINATLTLETFDVRSGRRLDMASPPPGEDDRGFTRIAEPCWYRG